MNIIHQPGEIKAQFRKEEAGWKKFFKDLLKLKSAELDNLLLPLAREVEALINCRTCANCCTRLEAGLSEEEVVRLAALRHQPLQEFIAVETETEMSTGTVFLSKKPCIFLDNCDCTIYADRPESCRNFPGLEQPGIKYRLRRISEHMEICPIVYNTFNQFRQQHLSADEQFT